MRKILTISLLLLSGLTFAKKWDAVYISKLIASGQTDKVIAFYKERYYGPERDPQDAYRIADLYVKKKGYATAMQWYDKEKQLLNNSKTNLFNYANTYRLMGEYQKALDAYLLYAALTSDVNKVMEYANQCERILSSANLAYTYKLNNYTYNTADNEDYVTLLRTNAVYITSKNTDDKLNHINQVVRQFDGFAQPVNAYNNNVAKLHITGLSFTKDGNTVIFSATDEKINPLKRKEKIEKLYTADYLGGDFLNIKNIPINTGGYTIKGPSVNAEGNTIYFASDMPGGSGGFDIWQTKLINNTWTAPKNLGALLNSAKDEINPFISQTSTEQKIYFASNRDGGFGGFDIYNATKTDDTWQGVELMPAPVNSIADEISITYDNAVKTGYFCSNREGGKGGFDLYRFIPFNLKLIATTNDTFSEKAIGYTLIQLFDGNNKIQEGVTDENGKATFQIDKDKIYTLKISKDSYRTVSQQINSAGKGSGDSLTETILLKPDAQYSTAKGATNSISLDNYILFTGTIADAATNKVAAKAKMRMMNYATQKVRILDIDSLGRFEIKLFLNNNYKIIIENQENKITDELTTLGMEKNTVKVRDYLLNGNKFKLTENRVYQASNLPPNRKTTLLENKPTKTETTSILQPFKDTATSLLNNTKQQTVSPITTDTIAKTTLNNASLAINTKANNNVTITKKIDMLDTTILSLKNNKDSIITSPPTFVSENNTQKTDIEPSTQLTADMISRTSTKTAPIKNSIKKGKSAKIVTEQQLVEKTDLTASKDSIATTKTDAEQSIKQISKATEPILATTNKTLTDSIQTIKTILNNNITTTTDTVKPIETKETPLPDVYYKIQLASYDVNNIKFPEFEKIGKIEIVNAYNRYIYRLGNFETLDNAKHILEEVRTQGYFVAFILQYNKGKVTGIIN